ncbi:MAG: tRNA lysidine(34) synthetase TilS [Candidatus Rickettsiella isopodorum]|jgi:tRNA(Ile)-lysidine synthase|nr:tRNA lysidine(34) synthetase TilS [Gammaproteobacteria bacterium]
MFTHEKLQFLLKQYPASICFWIAYSGGLDSQVLLYALNRLLPTKRLRVIHINHGWHVDSIKWANVCRHTCEKLGVYCEIISVDTHPKSGESPEAYAREVRYSAIAKRIRPGDFLLTAHHRNDQAETLLLQLVRGSGLKGLVSMPFCQRFAKGYLIRPLLDFTRTELYEYAQKHHLTWIEDDSNRDLRFNRNFIRHQVLPVIQQRWPQADKTIARAAANLAEAHSLLDEVAHQDWSMVQGSAPNVLIISSLMKLSAIRRSNLLRYWLQQLHFSLPSQKQLKQIDILLKSRVDASPQVNWKNIQLRRYRDSLYVLTLLENEKNFIFQGVTPWELSQTLILPTLDQLTTRQVLGVGLNYSLLIEGQVDVTFRQGGERFYASNRQGSHPLKKLFQEWGVPPWERNRVPLIYYRKELIAVAGYGINPHFAAKQNELGFVIELIPKSSDTA